MNEFLFSLNSVAPVFIIVLLGSLLKRLKIINDDFVKISAKFVFNVALPALVFVQVMKADFSKSFNVQVIAFIYIATVISFLLSWILAYYISKKGENRGVIIQGGFRGNFAIIGLALLENIYGIKNLSEAAIILAFILPLYNLLSIIALTVPLKKEQNISLSKIVFEIFSNPLLIALLLAVVIIYTGITIDGVVSSTLNYLSNLSLPLALIGIGGSLNFKDIKTTSLNAFASSFMKIIFIPIIFIPVAIYLDYDSKYIIIMFILFSSPTAIASYIMAEAMGGNGKLAGNIILITTLFSTITIAAGLYILKTFNFI